MGNIHDAVNFALAQQGHPYRSYGARFGPTYFDCSGLMKASLNAANIWSPDYATNSVGFYQWGRTTGHLVSVDQAIHTYGAMLIKGRWYGYGKLGHISFSLGDGRTMAARGYRSGIGISSAYGTRYQDGLIVPGADYADPIEEAVLKALALAIKGFHDIPMHKGDKRGDLVMFAKALLNKKFNAKLTATDPVFGDKMEAIVRVYQASRHLTADGVIGPKTIDMLVK